MNKSAGSGGCNHICCVLGAQAEASQGMAHVKQRVWWWSTCSPSLVTWKRRGRKQFCSLCRSSRLGQPGALPCPFALPGLRLEITSILHSFNVTETAALHCIMQNRPADVCTSQSNTQSGALAGATPDVAQACSGGEKIGSVVFGQACPYASAVGAGVAVLLVPPWVGDARLLHAALLNGNECKPECHQILRDVTKEHLTEP